MKYRFNINTSKSLMWNLFWIHPQKPNIQRLEQCVNDLIKMTTQKTAGQNKNPQPGVNKKNKKQKYVKAHISWEENLNMTLHSIVIEVMALYLSKNLDYLEQNIVVQDVAEAIDLYHIPKDTFHYFKKGEQQSNISQLKKEIVKFIEFTTDKIDGVRFVKPNFDWNIESNGDVVLQEIMMNIAIEATALALSGNLDLLRGKDEKTSHNKNICNSGR